MWSLYVLLVIFVYSCRSEENSITKEEITVYNCSGTYSPAKPIFCFESSNYQSERSIDSLDISEKIFVINLTEGLADQLISPYGIQIHMKLNSSLIDSIAIQTENYSRKTINEYVIDFSQFKNLNTIIVGHISPDRIVLPDTINSFTVPFYSNSFSEEMTLEGKYIDSLLITNEVYKVNNLRVNSIKAIIYTPSRVGKQYLIDLNKKFPEAKFYRPRALLDLSRVDVTDSIKNSSSIPLD